MIRESNPTLEQRFTQKYTVDNESGCWVWQAATTKGYGAIYFDGRPRGAHRAVYMLYVGPILDGMQLDHLCRNPLCVNPEHLELVTPRENTLRGESPSAQQARQTHCKYGHPLSGDNLYVPPSRPHRRDCRTCRAAVAERRKAEQHAAKTAARERARNYVPTIGYAPALVEGLQGTRVRIPVGVPVRTTYPGVDGWRPTERSQVVTVHHVLPGSEDGWTSGKVVSDPSVCWPGCSGYWREVPVQFIEKQRAA